MVYVLPIGFDHVSLVHIVDLGVCVGVLRIRAPGSWSILALCRAPAFGWRHRLVSGYGRLPIIGRAFSHIETVTLKPVVVFRLVLKDIVKGLLQFSVVGEIKEFVIAGCRISQISVLEGCADKQQ